MQPRDPGPGARPRRPSLGQTAPFGPGGATLLPGPGPAAPGGATGLTRQELVARAGELSPLALMAWSKMGQAPGHASNILVRLAQSGCCPGARASMRAGADPSDLSGGARQVRCADGGVYQLDNWQGGIRALHVAGPLRQAGCERVHEGTWMLVERGPGASGWPAFDPDASWWRPPNAVRNGAVAAAGAALLGASLPVAAVAGAAAWWFFSGRWWR